MSEKKETAVFPKEPETIKIFLDEEKHPNAFREAVLSLANSGIDIESAKQIIARTPFVLELSYSPDRGLFAIDSEAVLSLENDLFDPYTGENVIVLND